MILDKIITYGRASACFTANNGAESSSMNETFLRITLNQTARKLSAPDISHALVQDYFFENESLTYSDGFSLNQTITSKDHKRDEYQS